MSTMHEFDPNYPRPIDTPKFTPGPWKRCIGKGAIEVRGLFLDMPIGSPRNPRVCRVLHADPFSDSNARLIAAAPELCGTLKQIVIECTESPNSDSVRLEVILSLASAALAKAVQP